MISQNFVLLGSVISFSGTINYIIATLKGNVQPNRVTMFLWAAAPLIAFAGQIQEGVGLTALMTFMVGFGPLLIFVASFANRDSYWKITKFDYMCGFLSVLAIIMWMITKVGTVAIIFSILADALAAVPTILKTYRFPYSEKKALYSLVCVNALITLLAIDKWTLATTAFPAYMLALCVTLLSIIVLRRRKLLTTETFNGSI